MSIEINNIPALNVHDVNYRYIMVGITKSEALNLLSNADFSGKSGSSQNINFLSYTKDV